MNCAKFGSAKKLILALLALTMVASLMLPAAALETAPHTTVYLDGTGDGGVGTAEDPVNTLQKAYEVLLAVQNGIKDNAGATATIVVMGETTQSTHFANTSADLEHKGTVTFTSNDGVTDYATTKGAKLILASAASAEMRVQLPGPTVLDAVTLTTAGSKGAVTLYCGSWFKTTASAMVVCAMSGNERLFLRGGYAYRTNADNVTIDLNAGSFTFVVPTNAEAASTGSFTVTLSGSTTVNTFIGGETSSAASTTPKMTVTVNPGATVTNLYVAGDTGVVTDANVIVNGGTVGTLSSRRSGKTGTAGDITVTLVGNSALPGNTIAAMGSANFKGIRTLVLSGRTSTAEEVNSVWNQLKIKDSSNITMASALPTATKVDVETGSTLTLANGDNRKDITGGGTVNQACDHDWEEKSRVDGTCVAPGSVSYECKICPATKEDPLIVPHNPDANGVCTVCGAGRRVFFVMDGGTGDGSTPETPLGSLEDAYKKLIAGTDIEEAGTTTQGTIVLVGPTTLGANFNIPSSATAAVDGKAVNYHVGKLTITGAYDGVDYGSTASAALINGRSEDLYIQLGGPTVMENLTLTVAKPMRIYGGEDFTLGSGITVSVPANLTVHGGWCRLDTTADVKISILSGKVGAVSSTTYGKSHFGCEGNVDITVGGTAEVTTVYAGTIQTKYEGQEQSTPNVTVTVETGAKVGTYKAGGANGTVASSTLVLKGGTVGTITRGTGVTNANITLSGITNSAYTLPEGEWKTFTVTDSSDVTMAAALPEGISLVVDKNSKLTLYPGDATTHTGDGTETVVRTHEHDWIIDTSKTPVEGTCTTQGTEYYKCNVSGCTETKSQPSGYKHVIENGVCSVCGGSTSVVFVKDGGDGSGFTAATAVGSLKEAYAILIANTDIENDASVTGTIVICGKIESSENFNFENDGSCTHKGTVTLTSKYNDVDYRDSGAQLHLASAHTGTSSSHGTACEQRFQVGGPTIMENLTINRAGSKQPLTIYAGTYLYIDETVQTLDTNFTYTPPTPAISGLTDAQIATIELSAHRGYQPMGPENSILSFQAAANLGFTYIETDVYRTTDGELICIHDSTLDRTTNATGNVTQMTLAQVQAAKIDTAGYGYDITTADPTMLYVPTFREYLEICKAGGCKPFIELKDTRNDVTEEIIDMALEYFDAEDIVISSGYGNLLIYAHQYNPDVFIHKIWGSEGEIATYAAMLNSKGEHYAGIAFDIQNLHLKENYEKAERLIKLANDAGLQTCLRGADSLTQVRKMFDLGINYYPTNTTSPEMLEQLKTEIPGTSADFYNNGLDTKGTDDHRIFIRGGYNNATTTENISITLLGGQYDMVAPSNAEQASTGNYEMVVGGSAYISRLILGETGGSVTTDRATSQLTVQDDAIVSSLYLAGDKANVQAVTVDINGGRVKSMLSTRSNGKAGDLTVTVADVADVPASVTLNTSVITGEKELKVGGTGELGNCTQWDSITALTGATVTLTGDYPSDMAKEGTGKFLVNDQSITFGFVANIKADGAAVAIGTDIPYTASGAGALTTVWYADNNGVKGAALSAAPSQAGTYWVGLSMAEAASNNAALFHAAVPEQTVKFAIVHDLTEVGATAPDCTTDGVVKHYTCSGCDKIFADAEGKTELQTAVDPAGHKLTEVGATAPDCTTDGVIKHYTCSGCDKIFADAAGKTELQTAVDPAEGHKLTKVDATAPDCTTDGVIKHYTCSGCDKIFADAAGKTELQTAVDPAEGHKLTKVAAKAATEDAEGNIEHYCCSVCGKLYNDDKATKELTKEEVTIAKLDKPADETTKPTQKPTDSTSPDTGEGHSVIVAFWVMLGALLALVYTLKKRVA